GGVGVAPLLQLGKVLNKLGKKVRFLLGARSASDLLLLDEFKRWGDVFVSTEDGSEGEQGFVTQHSVLNSTVDHIACCGPLPMMKAVANIAKSKGIDCEVSLENMMACGLGACLCCVEDTADNGHVCVCKEGPVFNINRLKW
ncbi:MAG: dihydroorotate dehydrogenase electron transfer subunit, partial [Muribaculaceae bacterium]|nr:dihydroorotate dehydrogenase electron transfer subunit [Muribaculaceae bacterium]